MTGDRETGGFSFKLARYIKADERADIELGGYQSETEAIAVANAILSIPDTGLFVVHTMGYPVHRDCFACRAALARGVPFTALPCSETYWQS